MCERILIMGLPGSGKTTLAEQLVKNIKQQNKTVVWFNADIVRQQYNDWDFSYEGRIRQVERMRDLSDACSNSTDYVICDFVAPLEKIRNIFDAHWTIWLDTIEKGRFEDTNQIFEPPSEFHYYINEQDSVKWAQQISNWIIANPTQFSILPNLTIRSRIDQVWDFSGLDSVDFCQDIEWFENYPYDVKYQHNCRGFRDEEWSNNIDELQSSIWCIGDSFTVGIGNHQDHIWPTILQDKINIRTINISLDGASNDWIFKKSRQILDLIKPKSIVIQWSFVERCELDVHSVKDEKWRDFYNNTKESYWSECNTLKEFKNLPTDIQKICLYVNSKWYGHDKFWGNTVRDEDLRCYSSHNDTNDDIHRTLKYIDLLEEQYQTTNIIHTFVPNIVAQKYHTYFSDETKKITRKSLPIVERLDYARDKHHYGVKTATKLVDDIILLL